MRNSMISSLFVLSLTAMPAFAQQAPAGVEVTASQPGRVVMANKVKASALVTAIDKSTRTISLKGPKGKAFDVVAGDEVKNFDQIEVSDEVVVVYARALSLEVKKGGDLRQSAESVDAARAQPGDKPAGGVGRQLTIIADVVDVNAKKKTITLRGPKGNVVELDVKNPDHFKVVKKGDQVQVDYVEAVAVAVQPATKK